MASTIRAEFTQPQAFDHGCKSLYLNLQAKILSRSGHPSTQNSANKRTLPAFFICQKGALDGWT
jgi:hypothetical protein